MYDKICPVCGTRLSSFYNTGMLGCENCYTEFAVELQPTLKKIQGRNFHAGKKPKLSKLEHELLAEYTRLIAEKEQATIEGRFSDVKEMNEIIVSLAKELQERGLI